MNNIYLLIAAGGACGAVARYVVSGWINGRYPQYFPYGTFFVNLSGCFLLGLFYTLSLERLGNSPQLKTMITVGFLGAFTTFSTFSLEGLNLLKEGKVMLCFLYVGLSVFLGILALWIGMGVAGFLNKLA